MICKHNYTLEETSKDKDSTESYNFNYWNDTIYKKFRCTKCLETKVIKDGIVNSGARE